MATIKSLEEKAKAYDEALERAKELLEVGLKDTRDKRVVLSFFPELAESEDEKSKKWILEYLHDGLRKSDEQFKDHFKAAIAWLEKQGEQEPTAEEVLIKAGLKPYKDGNQWCILKGENIQEGICGFGDNIEDALIDFLRNIPKISLEVKEVDFWHKQSEEDIDDSIIGWSMHSFICLMKDGTTQEFTGIQDESYEGSISKHLDCVDDNYEWKYDDIIYWIEVPNIKAQKGEKV